MRSLEVNIYYVFLYLSHMCGEYQPYDKPMCFITRVNT